MIKSAQFKLNDENKVRALHVGFSDDPLFRDLSIDINKIEYEYSESGSTITLHLFDYELDIQRLDSTIEIDNDLTNIYEQYSETYNDQLLSGLEPIDVFKLYVHASAQQDKETVDNLFAEDETGLSEEESFGEISGDESFDIFKYLNASDEFIFMHSEEGMAILLFSSDENNRNFFLEQNDENVWKFSPFYKK